MGRNRWLQLGAGWVRTAGVSSKILEMVKVSMIHENPLSGVRTILLQIQIHTPLPAVPVHLASSCPASLLTLKLLQVNDAVSQGGG